MARFVNAGRNRTTTAREPVRPLAAFVSCAVSRAGSEAQTAEPLPDTDALAPRLRDRTGARGAAPPSLTLGRAAQGRPHGCRPARTPMPYLSRTPTSAKLGHRVARL